jgi:adenylate cyclase
VPISENSLATMPAMIGAPSSSWITVSLEKPAATFSISHVTRECQQSRLLDSKVASALGRYNHKVHTLMPAIAASIALVPFENLSGDPAQDVFARGFVEDIASALSRFGTLEVVYPRALATASAARGGNEATSMATTVLRGSVRRAADTIRITVQLLDAQGGRHP